MYPIMRRPRRSLPSDPSEEELTTAADLLGAMNEADDPRPGGLPSPVRQRPHDQDISPSDEEEEAVNVASVATYIAEIEDRNAPLGSAASRNEANVLDITTPEGRNEVIELFQCLELGQGSQFLAAMQRIPIGGDRFGRGYVRSKAVMALKRSGLLDETYKATSSRINNTEKAQFDGKVEHTNCYMY
jgi:hypothetical protein